MRGACFVLVAFMLALAGSASARAGGPPTDCTGSFTGAVSGNLVVPSGAFCTLLDSSVVGSVVVEPEAIGFHSENSTITGSVLAPGPISSGVLLVDTTVGQNVHVARTQAGTSSGICGSSIGGNVILVRNAGFVTVGLDFPVCPFPGSRNEIGGDLIVTGNSGGIAITFNTVGTGVHINSNTNFQEIVNNEIGLILECNNNGPSPFPFSVGNTAKVFVGQCTG
jgi:hypothetical protein